MQVSVCLLGVPAGAQTPQSSALAPDQWLRQVTPEAINCSNSPFGNTLEVGGEKEVIFPLRHFLGTLKLVNAFKIDPDPFAVSSSGFLAHKNDISAASVRALSSKALNFDGNFITDLAVGYLGQHLPDLAGSDNAPHIMVYKDLNLDSTETSSFKDHWKDFPVYDRLELGSGNVDGDSGDRDEIIMASRYGPGVAANGKLFVGFFFSDAGGGVQPGNFSYSGFYSTTLKERDKVDHIAVASGDVNLDGKDEIVAAFVDKVASVQILVLRHKPGVNVSTSTLGAENLEELATIQATNSVGGELVRVAVGNVRGGQKKEVVVAWLGDKDNDDRFSTLHVRVFELQGSNLVQTSSLQKNGLVTDMALSLGDTDADGLKEVVVAHNSLTGGPPFFVGTYDAGTSTLIPQRTFQKNTSPLPDYSDTPERLALATGDADKDGREDIFLVYKDHATNDQYFMHLEEQTSALTLIRNQLLFAGASIDSRTLGIHVADLNKDSVLARYQVLSGTGLQCQQVVEPQILTAAFAPPYWKKLQSNGQKKATISDTTSQATKNSTGLSSRSSHSVSAYVGASVGGSAFGIGAEATAKATAGYEYAVSTGTEQGVQSGNALTEGWASNGMDDAMIVYEAEKYNCYNYNLKRDNTAQSDGNMRFCQYVDRSQFAPSINSWETVEGLSPQNALSWVPVARDWASLALFRFAGVKQSSTGFGGVATRAVDGDTSGQWGNGSVTHTNNEFRPWWEVDLGSLEQITKIRLWNRTDCCGHRLKDLYVFVSQNPFPSNDPTVLSANPAIKTYRHTDYIKQSISFLTRQAGGDPIKGRYVRVQLNGTNYLSLAEVQIFGQNHVDPDRYPKSINITNQSTGAFSVTVWDPIGNQDREVKMRGRLLFDGVAKNVWANSVIAAGGTERSWSLSSSNTTFNTTTMSTEHSVRVGAEFDFKGGAVAQVVAGGSYEFSTGLTENLTKEISWGTAFELGGSVQGFDAAFNTPAFTLCNYGAQPYSYEVTEVASSGYEHKFLVVDYVVPNSKLDRNSELDWFDLGNCRTTELNYTNYFPLIAVP